MVQVGLLGGELNLSLVSLVAKVATITGSSTGTVLSTEEVAKLARDGILTPIPVTEISYSKAPEALMLLRDGKVTGRLVLTRS